MLAASTGAQGRSPMMARAGHQKMLSIRRDPLQRFRLQRGETRQRVGRKDGQRLHADHEGAPTTAGYDLSREAGAAGPSGGRGRW